MNEELRKQNRILLQNFVATRFTRQAEKHRLQGLRWLKLAGVAMGLGALTHAGFWAWYYLEYDINIHHPQPTDYLLNRLK
jgi:hypothetical protein